MTDFLFQMGLSNACFSLALAITALIVGATVKRAHLTHMLWLFVFVKLLTPPIVTIPVVTMPAQPETTTATDDHSHSRPPPTTTHEFDRALGTNPRTGALENAGRASAASWLSSIGAVLQRVKPWLVSVWFAGSVVALAWSLVRIFRFNRLLAMESEVAPQPLQVAAVKLCAPLGDEQNPDDLHDPGPSIADGLVGWRESSNRDAS